MKKILVIVLALVSLLAFAQQQRPKIGLVLSGGGAKGLAHIGVLEAIDSAGLQIDYITGTSMGSIIAGMYAAGYNAKEIRKVGLEMDWMGAIMSRTTKYEDLNIDAQDDYGNYVLELPMDEGFKFKIHNGIFEPQEVILKLEEIFFPVYKIKDYNKLKIPFKCIATNLRDGSAVVIDHGDLAFATRSSMAIPGVFSATKYKDTRLVDGGVVRNFPVQDVRDMGADYVIGVNLFEGLTDPDQLTNALDVMMQVMNFRDADDLIEEKSVCDMIIEPNVTGFSAGCFGASDVLTAIGDTIGREFYPLFKQLADSLNRAYGVPYAKNDGIGEYYKKVRIKKFSFEGLKKTDDKLLIHNLSLRLNREYTVQELNEAVRRAHTSQYYSNIRYELYPVDDENGVEVKFIVEELPLSFLGAVLSYNTFSGAGVTLGYKRKNLLARRSLSEAKVAISESFRARVSHKMYFGKEYDHYAKLMYDFSAFDIPVYNKKEKTAEYGYRRTNISATVSHITRNTIDWQISGGFETYKIYPDVVKDTVLYDGRVRNGFVNIRARHKTTNRKLYPQKGIDTEFNMYAALHPRYRFSGLGELRSVHDNVYRATFKSSFYQQLSPKASLFEGVGLAATYGDKSFVHRTYLGGMHAFMPSHFEFAGLNTAHLQESTMGMFKMGFQYMVVDDLYAIIQANTAVTYLSLDKYFGKNKVEDQQFKVEHYVNGAQLTLAYNYLTFMPFDVSLLYSPEYKFNVMVNVGLYF